MSRPIHVLIEELDTDGDGSITDETVLADNLSATGSDPTLTLTDTTQDRNFTITRANAGTTIATSAGNVVIQPFTNIVTIRQGGGVPGTDEFQMSHNGTDGVIAAQSGSIVIENGAGDEQLRYVDVPVSSAEILALNGTPKTLIAAPGASKAIVVNKAIFFLDYNSAAYAGIAAGEDLVIKYATGGGAVMIFQELTGFLDQTSDQRKVAYAGLNVSGGVNANITLAENSAVVLQITTGEITTGDSPMGVRVFYDIVDLSTLSAT